MFLIIFHFLYRLICTLKTNIKTIFTTTLEPSCGRQWTEDCNYRLLTIGPNWALRSGGVICVSGTRHSFRLLQRFICPDFLYLREGIEVALRTWRTTENPFSCLGNGYRRFFPSFIWS